MGLAADWLRPIYEQIRTGVMAGGYLQIDETPIRYLSPGHGQTKLGYFWTALSPGGDVVYHWETSRGADCLKNVIAADFQGTLQCDGYVAYGPTGALLEITRAKSPWRDAGPTCDATSTRRASRARSVADGSCARSLISTASRKPAPQRGRSKKTRRVRWERLDEDLAFGAKELDRSILVPSQILSNKASRRSRMFGRRREKPLEPEVSEESCAIDPARSRDDAWAFLEILEDSRNQKPAKAIIKAGLCWFKCGLANNKAPTSKTVCWFPERESHRLRDRRV